MWLPRGAGDLFQSPKKSLPHGAATFHGRERLEIIFFAPAKMPTHPPVMGESNCSKLWLGSCYLGLFFFFFK